jgi:hypothetical protein
MTLATAEVQTGINRADFESLVGAPMLRPSVGSAGAGAEHQGVPASSRDRIRRAVSQLRDRDFGAAEQLRQPRAAFVRPAKLWFVRSGSNAEAASWAGERKKTLRELAVVTVNLSPIGAGVLVSTRHEPLPPQVTLEVDGVAFDCDVRWSRVLGTNVTRYGLLLRDATPAAAEAV